MKRRKPSLTQAMRWKLLRASGLLQEEGSNFCTRDEYGNMDRNCPNYPEAIEFIETANWITDLALSGEGIKKKEVLE